jgi:peptide/nickel transport system substrate-binding protein
MIDRTTKLRWRRRLKKRRQQVEDIGKNAEIGLEKHFFRRLGRLMLVWRFAASWLALLVLVAVGTIIQIRGLSQYYQTLKPTPGGTYTEGIIGRFTTANPLYATSAADSSVARLVFSGLMRYNTDNRLVPDVAKEVTVDTSGKIYTVVLRDGIRWHDGQPLTAKDVVFTYNVIKNPDARSPLFNTWKDITVTERDARTVVFELPNTLSTFPESLTNGLVPMHVLGARGPSQLRTARFNTVAPVGSGPFKWEKLEVAGTTQEERQEIVGLLPNDRFYRSPPKIGHFILRTFRDESHMVQAYEAGELTSMVGLASIPDSVRTVSDFNEYSIPLTGEVMVFFKTTTPPFDDVKVRRALVQAVDTTAAVQALGYPVKLAKGPLLDTHIGYDPTVVQLPYDPLAAAAGLDKAGWVMDVDGVRKKGGVPLTFTLYAQNTSDYSAVTGYLQKTWKALGVKVEVLLQSDADMQGVVSRHDYGALLYGISIGTDPDVFAYWHSSQANPTAPVRLNLSEYKSKAADAALEAGRTRLDAAVRPAKYAPFLKAWQSDAPALALYQPTFIYVTRGKVFNFEPQSLTGVTNRYVNVENWMIRQERVTK